ncbi:hypothetical protein D3C71_18760 [compost metagenome]
MKTLSELAATLREQVKRLNFKHEDLRHQAGISRQTLTNVLSGRADYRVTTLLTLADRLGLELVMVPKTAAAALEQGTSRPAVVRTAVQAAMEGRRPPSFSGSAHSQGPRFSAWGQMRPMPPDSDKKGKK